MHAKAVDPLFVLICASALICGGEGIWAAQRDYAAGAIISICCLIFSGCLVSAYRHLYR